MKKCPNCGAELTDETKFCINCGTEIPAGFEEPATAVEVVEEKVDAVVEDVKEAVEEVQETVAEVSTEAVETVEETVEAATQEVNEAAEQVQEAVEEAKDATADVVEAVEEKVAEVTEPQVEIPMPKKAEESEIHLTLEGFADELLAKVEVDTELAEAQRKREEREAAILKAVEEKEDDLSSVLTNTSVDTQTIANAQAQRVNNNPIELSIPEETEKQVEAKESANDFLAGKVESLQQKVTETVKENIKVDNSRFEKAAEAAEKGKNAATDAAQNVKKIVDTADEYKAEDGRETLIAGISYISFIGWIVSLIMSKDQKRSKYLKGHLNAALVLNIISLIVTRGIFSLLRIPFTILWIYFVFLALSGKYKALSFFKDFNVIK